jgi:hypothetical protein
MRSDRTPGPFSEPEAWSTILGLASGEFKRIPRVSANT